MVRTGRISAVLGAPAVCLRPGIAIALQDRCPPVRLRVRDYCRGSSFLFAATELRRESFRRNARHVARGWYWAQPAIAVSRDGDSSAHVVSGLRRIHRAVRLCIGGFDHALSRREMDSDHPPLDHGYLGIPHLRRFFRRALGLLRAGMGRILGMGSRRKRVADALAHRYCVPALGNDAGEARNAEDLEHVADFFHVHALDLRNVLDAQRRCQFCACLRAILNRRLVRCVSCHHFCHLPLLLCEESVAPAHRA